MMNVKKFLFIMLCLSMQRVAFGQNSTDSIYITPTEIATFVGGDSARIAFIRNNLKIDDIPADNIKSTIYVQFVVEKTGMVSNAKILKGIKQSIDNKVVSMVMSMPAWAPAQQDGQIVRSQIVMPLKLKSEIIFVLPDTAYYNKDWKKTAIDSAAYYRIRKGNGSIFNICYYQKNGTIIEQGDYSSLFPEKKHGHFIAYLENGAKLSEYNCVNDTIQGEAVDYYPSGKIKMKYNYLNNLKDGNSFEYLENDSLLYKRIFKRGVLLSVSAGQSDPYLPLMVVDEMPDFPGGDEARIDFLSKNLHYPAYARDEDIEGTVYIEFVVEIDGSLTNIKVKRGIGGGCDEECLRVLKLMPNWKPGKQKGRLARVQYMIPMKFILH
jgi:TonB family protein